MFYFFTEPQVAAEGGVDLSPIYASRTGSAFSAATIGQLYQDSAGTTPVTGAGDPVGKVEKDFGNSDDATMANSTFRPTYEIDGSGVPYFELDGINNALRIAPTPGTASYAFCLFMAIEIVDTQGVLLSNENDGSIYTLQYLDGSASSPMISSTWDSYYDDGASDTVPTTRDIFHTDLTASTIKTVIFNITLANGTSYTNGLHVPSPRPLAVFAPEGKMYAVGWVDEQITNGDDVTLINNYLKEKAGL